MSDTPETDALIESCDQHKPHTNFGEALKLARNLERRLQEAQRERYELRDKVKSLAFSRESAIGYLTRNVLEPHGVTPLSTAGGICTQVDNIVAGLKVQRDAALREVEEHKSRCTVLEAEVAEWKSQFAAALAEKGEP